MQALNQDNGVLNTILSSKTHIGYVQQNVIGILSNIITKSSYLPYSGCVLEHILHTASLTHNAKLFYLIADALSLINDKDAANQRSVALPSIKWAKKLNCSKTEIFSMQKSLEEKGYFVIIRDTNKFGKNQRNIIIPTLPDQVFQQLYTEPDRYDLNPKDKNLIPSPTYLSTLTSLSKSTDPFDSLDMQASKRTYLDKTKLFIKINYQILHLITSSEQLSSFAKILWLYFYSKCYKNHLKSKQFNTDQHSNDYFAFTSSYLELETQFACSKAQLSKAINSLEKFAYINRSRFHVKNNNENDNLHDKSLWTIIASLPQEYYQQITQFKPRLSTKKKRNISICDPYISNSGQLLIKDFILNNDIKNLDSTDANLNFFENSKNLQNSESLSNLSEFYKNSLEEKKEDQYQKSCQIEITNVELTNNPSSEKSNINQEKVLSSTVAQCTDPVKIKETPVVNTNPTISTNKNINPSKNIVNKTEIKINNDVAYKKNVNFSPNSTLKDWYPLLTKDVDKLNSKSGREFSSNFVNELLLKLNHKYPGRLFPTKNHVISYLTKALLRELHQSPMVNHETFRFARGDDEFIAERQREKYLAEVEYSTDTSYTSQLRRKIAALFEPKLAYQLLTTAKFITTVQEQRSGNNCFDDQYLDIEPTTIIQEEDALSDDILDNQQPDIIQNNQNNSFTVKLYQDISLSDLQQQILENAVTSVYGHVDITYKQVHDNYRKLDKLQPRQQYEIYLEELDLSSTWYKIRAQLKEQFGDSIDKAWFSKLTAEENLEIKTLTLFAPSNFIKDWINNKYGYVIKQFAGKLSYQVVELTTKKHV